ncbi:MAG: kinase/pyrophosphorylase [Verrucomicrobia bacterium]|nr:kinase/pyrophosphorylase [Verrucomicrobiota bacterium]MCH8510383.1 kinase/pyrophosphorylase [Kiritimatiellia bacterium]
MAAKKSKWILHIVSDATGNLGSHMLHSVLTQFPEDRFELQYHLFADREKEIRDQIGHLKGERHLVFHGVLSPDHKALVRELCDARHIPHYDLIGGLVGFLEKETKLKSANDLEKLHPVDAHYFERIRAMEFTAQHDDNRRLETIGEAEIVIVGLSRVSKSPTSTWLGSLGYKVANVAISRETGFPEALDYVRDRTVAFTMRPKDLHEIRRRRFEGFHDKISEQDLAQLPYYDLRSIVSEVAWVEKEYRARKYPIIDISGQTVEEVAARVITTLKPQKSDLLNPV